MTLFYDDDDGDCDAYYELVTNKVVGSTCLILYFYYFVFDSLEMLTCLVLHGN